MTIVSSSRKFIFIKGRKVAGTSVEVGLSELCQSSDILTPVTPIDEVLRYQRSGLTAQNYGADKKKIERYRNLIRSFPNNLPEDWSSVRKPRGDYQGHMSLKDIEQVYGKLPADWAVIAISRNPYNQALSRIKHRASKALIQRRCSEPQNIDSASFEVARSEFFKKAREKSLCLNIDLYKDKFGKLRPTFVIRFEQLNEDFLKLATHFGHGSPPRLSHLKKVRTSQDLKPESFFRDEEISIINECFDEEFRAFGYKKLAPSVLPNESF